VTISSSSLIKGAIFVLNINRSDDINAYHVVLIAKHKFRYVFADYIFRAPSEFPISDSPAYIIEYAQESTKSNMLMRLTLAAKILLLKMAQ